MGVSARFRRPTSRRMPQPTLGRFGNTTYRCRPWEDKVPRFIRSCNMRVASQRMTDQVSANGNLVRGRAVGNTLSRRRLHGLMVVGTLIRAQLWAAMLRQSFFRTERQQRMPKQATDIVDG